MWINAADSRDSTLLPVTELHNSPFTTPSPFSRTRVASASFSRPDLLVFTLWKTNNHISFARPKSKRSNARVLTKWTNGLLERRRWIPYSL